MIKPGCTVKRFGQWDSFNNGIEGLLICLVELNSAAELLAKVIRENIFG